MKTNHRYWGRGHTRTKVCARVRQFMYTIEVSAFLGEMVREMGIIILRLEGFYLNIG